MDWHVWLAFVAASIIMGLIPGPGVTSIVGYALGSGRQVALSSVAGIAIGNLVAVSLSLAGVGAVLAASAVAFLILKWAGALYLIGIGAWTIWRTRGAETSPVIPPPISPRAAFFSNIAVGTFHPKTVIFFVAFAPQFISPHGSYPLQATILTLTYCATLATTDTLYALAASRASGWLRNAKAIVWAKRAGGGVLVAAGLATAAARN